MAYLVFRGSEETQNFSFKLLGNTTKPTLGGLTTNNTSLLSSNDGADTCSFYSGPSDSTILSFGENYESTGSIAYTGSGESCGSIAYSGTSSFSSAGSCVSSSSSGSSMGGGCSFTC